MAAWIGQFVHARRVQSHPARQCDCGADYQFDPRPAAVVRSRQCTQPALSALFSLLSASSALPGAVWVGRQKRKTPNWAHLKSLTKRVTELPFRRSRVEFV